MTIQVIRSCVIDGKPYLSTKETAKRIGVSYSTLRVRLHRGKLDRIGSVRVGMERFYSEDDVAAYVTRQGLRHDE